MHTWPLSRLVGPWDPSQSWWSPTKILPVSIGTILDYRLQTPIRFEGKCPVRSIGPNWTYRDGFESIFIPIQSYSFLITVLKAGIYDLSSPMIASFLWWLLSKCRNCWWKSYIQVCGSAAIDVSQYYTISMTSSLSSWRGFCVNAYSCLQWVTLWQMWRICFSSSA